MILHEGVAARPPAPDTREPDPARETDAALVLTHVTVRHPGLPALHDVSLTVRHASTVVLTGAAGDGASTVIGTVLGLHALDGGEVRVLGMDPGVAVATGRVGAMLASSELPDGVTTGDLLRFISALQASPIPLADLVARTGLGRCRDLGPERLSGGQRQLVRLALAITGDPDLVLLDAPFADLDPVSEAIVRANLARFREEGRTVLIATAPGAVVPSDADRVVRLERGRLLEDPRPGVSS